MNPVVRKILLILVIGLLLFTGIGFYLVNKVTSFIVDGFKTEEIPEPLKESRVLKETLGLSKTELFKMSQTDFPETIRRGSRILDRNEREKFIDSQAAKGFYGFEDLRILNNEIIAAGKFGAFVFDLNGAPKREILFDQSVTKVKIGPFDHENRMTNLDNLKIVELERGKFGFLSFDSMAGALVYDENGQIIWNHGARTLDMSTFWESEEESDKKFEESDPVLEAAVGDLDNDGISEYIVARKNDGLRVFDRQGNEKWFQPDKFPSDSLFILDVDGDGKNELLEVGNSNKLRTGDGTIIREIKGAISDQNPLLIETKDKKSALMYCEIRQGKTLCKDEAGQKIFEVEAPLSSIPKENPQKIQIGDDPKLSFIDSADRVAFPKSVRVQLTKDKPKHLALIGPFIGIPRANLYVYDEKGTLVYHELLPEKCETIAVLPRPDGTEEIFVGGKDTIWRFAVK